MLWRRRNEGFEWKEYVRTTVLARRHARRQRLVDAREAAAEGLREAGKKGAEAGAAGARAASRSIGAALLHAANLTWRIAVESSAAFVRLTDTLRTGTGRATIPLTNWLSTPPRRRILALTAVAGTVAAGLRVAQFGWDSDAMVLTAVVATLAILSAWPAIFPLYIDRSPAKRDLEDHAATSTDASLQQRPGTGLSSLSAVLPGAAVAGLAAVALWFAVSLLPDWWTADATPGPAVKTAGPAPQLEQQGVLRGRATTAGAGLVRIGGQTVKLAGIIPLHADQTCQRENGPIWTCGRDAIAATERYLKGRRAVDCVIVSDGGNVPLADCDVQGRSIAAQLVRAGFAFAEGWIWPRYAAEEEAAREDKAGVWSGNAERPADWLDRVWQDAATASPAGCPIKGYRKRSRRYFALPSDRDYGRISVKTELGEQWFCSEEEAQAAGYTPRDRS